MCNGAVDNLLCFESYWLISMLDSIYQFKSTEVVHVHKTIDRNSSSSFKIEIGISHLWWIGGRMGKIIWRLIFLYLLLWSKIAWPMEYQLLWKNNMRFEPQWPLMSTNRCALLWFILWKYMKELHWMLLISVIPVKFDRVFVGLDHGVATLNVHAADAILLHPGAV